MLLDYEIAQYNISGSTLIRSKSFLLQMAQYVGIKVNPELMVSTTSRNSHFKKQHNTISATNCNELRESYDSQTIALQSGGKVKIELSIPIFELSKSDRDFVFNIIDQLRDYGQRTKNKEEA
jgi:hypothetical protein